MADMAPAAADDCRSEKAYTWEEVSQHVKDDSLWVYKDNSVYDITGWLEKHPGGKSVIRLSAGRDVTDLVTSYHPFSLDKVEKVLASYRIGTLKTSEHPRFAPDTGFYAKLRERVGDYFVRTKQDYKNPVPGFLRLFFVLVVGISTFLLANLGGLINVPWSVRMLAAVVFGVCQVLPLLQVMHDASHFALGRQPWMWEFFGKLTMDFYAGASLDSWLHQHILGHHIYTNVLGADPDLPVADEGDIRRLTVLQKWLWPYRFQHLYLPILYGLLAVKVRLTDFTATMMQGVSGPIRVNPQKFYFYFEKFLSKAVFFTWRLIVPIYIWKVRAAEVFSLFLITEVVSGMYLAYNFQVSHISPDAAFPTLKNNINTEWAIVQVTTSVDYAHGNSIMTFMSGALNYQTVHHLFPCVAQVYYPEIAPIIMSTCKEFGIHYNVLPDFSTAFLMHLKHLYNMGNKFAQA
eukprot:TRINITY_DN2125_c0_g1_i1.p1 TRINITY_DN2125_c0_g1~~TRINITY_DN2125_c0_g1_i1.p1  ORF type:complete len:460 (-),score=121.47 TRINITY_DN2125_c0_g1_i1:91-1470(-)